MDYRKKYLKYKAKYLHCKSRTPSNQVGGDILTSQYRVFIKTFKELQKASINDTSFSKVDDAFIKELMSLEEKEKALIEKKIKTESIEEKIKIGQEEETPLKLRFAELKKDKNWTNFEKMKKEFYSLDSEKDLTTWVIKHYKEGNIKKVEDIRSRLKPAIENFKWLQKKDYIEKNKKITDFGGLSAVEDFLDKPDIQEKLKEKYKDEKGITESKEGGEIIYDGQDIKIIHPITKEGSCYYGKGTRWCTAAVQAENMFEHYNKEGPLYIIQPKKPERENEKYQLHFEEKQLMDEKDESVNLYELYKKFPELENLKTRVPDLFSYLLSEYFRKKNVINIKDVENLLNKGADVNIKYISGNTPLLYAVQNTGPDAFKIVELLISKNADVNFKNKYLDTPLLYAVQNTGLDAFKIVELLISKNVDVKDEIDGTPLLYAARNSGPDAFKIVELIISKNADVNVKDQYHNTPLLYAVQNTGPDAFKIVELLLSKNADVNVYVYGKDRDHRDHTPLSHAVQNTGPDAFKIVELLLNKNADVNVTDHYGNTPLFSAVVHTGPDAFKIVELILSKNADVNVKNYDENTPLFLAVEKTSPDAFKIVELLLSKNADVNVKNDEDDTPLSYAVQNTGPDASKIVELLKKHGAK